MCNFEEYDKSLCCGCGSCELICPHECITMEFDEEGFLYPILNEEQCTQCGLCRLRCPIIKETRNTGIISSYGLIHKDKNVTDDSASGGAFTAIAEYVLSRKGVVFGCAFNENIEAITVAVEKREDLHLLRGSKYVQCNTNKQYRIIKEMLECGRYVLYCATPCQIAGLKAYLKKEYDKLILVDLFCHGTPSPGLFKRYIAWLGEKHNAKVTEYSFRDKRYGWGTKGHYCTEREFVLHGSDPYYYSFLMGRTYRPVCYQCKYATANRPGDVTIGDFWGVEMHHPNIPIVNGVSAVLINTQKGQKVFDNIKDHVRWFNTTFENISSHNGQLIHPTEKYAKRDKIYSHLNKWTFERLANRYLYYEPIMITRIRRVIPESIKKVIRKYLK